MFWLLLRGLTGGVGGMCQLPCLIIGSVGALAAMCGCVACLRWVRSFRCRDIPCVRKWLRATGTDNFDDFNLAVHVHEVKFECDKKLKFKVRVSAGEQVAKTSSKSGIFQSTLNIFVQQGTEELVVEAITEAEVVIAQMKLSMEKDILKLGKFHEQTYRMKQMTRGVLNPGIRLTFSMCDSADEETGLLVGRDPQMAFLMKQQLNRAEETLHSRGDRKGESEQMDLEVLMHACAGPVEVFGALGRIDKRYIGVMGPPLSRRFFIGLWKEQQHFEDKGKELLEIEILKIHSVQADPGRDDIFVISYFDRARVSKKLTCRIVDRPAKLWVDFMHLIITKVHDYSKAKKKESSR